MFAGHIGAGLAIGRADRRINVGVLISAALLLDAVLWLFILLGWESVSIPADFAASYQPHFNFPYSHSLSEAWPGQCSRLWRRTGGSHGPAA